MAKKRFQGGRIPPSHEDASAKYLWWKRGIIYQIYPRSFQDSNGDGIGDLPGITSRLDYLHWLGVDAIWISPIYPSPMVDFGYDITNYTSIHSMFGTLDDFDSLVSAAHGLGIKVILDYVPNHTSDQHPWFLQSRSSRNNPKRDWYIWHDPAPEGGPPNNWLANFGGSAWTFDEKTGQYYYHAYLPEQPDLNWRNAKVQRAMLDVLHFWLDRGVDSFRVDVLWHLIKDAKFRDEPPNPDYVPSEGPYNSQKHIYSADRPEVHKIIAKMRQVLNRYPGDQVLIGEIYLPVERLITYYGEGRTGADLPFNFQLIKLPWNARIIRKAVDHYEAMLPPGGWPNWVLGNHDKHRIASRIGITQARVAAMMLLTLRGTPTMYYGDEIGMCDLPIPPDRVQDPFEKNVPGLGLGRDPERTPMQWDGTRGAGFSAGNPWLPLSEDFKRDNVAAERENRDSMLNLYRRLIDLRRSEAALSVGDYRSVDSGENVFAFLRREGSRRFLIALNLSCDSQSLPLGVFEGRISLSTRMDRESETVRKALDLRESEGVIIELE